MRRHATHRDRSAYAEFVIGQRLRADAEGDELMLERE